MYNQVRHRDPYFRMAEQFRHNLRILPGSEQVAGKGVSERMNSLI